VSRSSANSRWHRIAPNGKQRGKDRGRIERSLLGRITTQRPTTCLSSYIPVYSRFDVVEMVAAVPRRLKMLIFRRSPNNAAPTHALTCFGVTVTCPAMNVGCDTDWRRSCPSMTLLTEIDGAFNFLEAQQRQAIGHARLQTPIGVQNSRSARPEHSFQGLRDIHRACCPDRS